MEELIKQLIKDGYLKTPLIIGAFEKIKREDFVPDDLKGEADINAPLPIGYGQTISQPLTVAFMLELLQPKPDDKILDIGSGSGWQTA
ncbi:MAG: protein-L-isoaspartate O-methyltransferase, partial [bacterium]|nr:protein-L-isoaspartate O-methyltransferase [bacterium]